MKTLKMKTTKVMTRSCTTMVHGPWITKVGKPESHITRIQKSNFDDVSINLRQLFALDNNDVTLKRFRGQAVSYCFA